MIFGEHVILMPHLTMLKIYVQIQNLHLHEALQELLAQAGVCVKEDIEECEGVLYTPPALTTSLPSLNFSSLSQPVRFLDLLSLLENLPYSQEITFFHFTLDLREKVLKNTDTQQEQRITEKECQLLRFFHQNKGKELSRDMLLKEIWAYHPEVETHTLETHIYRLRQKLEDDPNVPQILLNCKDGYWMKEIL
jgi:DNA-binding response OmpR family regulator